MALPRADELLDKINKLSPTKKQEVLDFVDFLESRAREEALMKIKKRLELKTFHLGEVKGSLSRKEIYEDR